MTLKIVWISLFPNAENGYVEEAELDSFLREFVSVILPDQPHSGVRSLFHYL